MVFYFSPIAAVADGPVELSVRIPSPAIDTVVYVSRISPQTHPQGLRGRTAHGPPLRANYGAPKWTRVRRGVLDCLIDVLELERRDREFFQAQQAGAHEANQAGDGFA